MDTYVNAIGFEILLTKEEHTLLAGKASSLFFYDKDEDIWTLRSYKNHGLHAEIKSVKSSFEDPLYNWKYRLYESVNGVRIYLHLQICLTALLMISCSRLRCKLRQIKRA